MDYVDRKKLYNVLEKLVDSVAEEEGVMVLNNAKNIIVEETITKIEKLNILKEDI